jgi:polysaccharide export outer membrane protein
MVHIRPLFARQRAFDGARSGEHDAIAARATRDALLRACGRCAAVSAVIAAALGGCAMSPGMSYSSMPGAVATARAASDQSGSTGGARGADVPPPGGLVEINSDLIDKEHAARSKTISTDIKKLFGTPGPYTLGPGDVLNIVVWDHPEMNMPNAQTGGGGDGATSSVISGYTIDAGGMIQMAYVGPIQVTGLTEMQARDFVTQKLSRYLRSPQVTLRIEAYRSKRVYVDGEVRNPGLQVMNDMPMTLPEAINRAGGFTANGDRSEVSITRGDDTVVVSIPDMIRKGVNPDHIMLKSGDLVRVYSQNDSKVFVVGEVQHPGSVSLNNGHISLNEALGSAGGINQGSGDASQVYVVRGRDEKHPKVFHLDASSPASMATADGFDLKPNDVVFVDASPLVRWSRVINLILPSTQAAATSRAIGY